jgi:hypothetical protein
MAERVVLLGPSPDTGGVGTFCHALEMTALDADALRRGGVVKVRLAQFSGELANATVLDLTDEYVASHGSLEKAWDQIDGFLGGHMGTVRRVSVKTPIPLWNGGRRRFDPELNAAGHVRLIPEEGDLARTLAPIKLDSRKHTIPKGQNVLIDGVSADDATVTVKWIDDEGTHLLHLAATEVEAVP